MFLAVVSILSVLIFPLGMLISFCHACLPCLLPSFTLSVSFFLCILTYILMLVFTFLIQFSAKLLSLPAKMIVAYIIDKDTFYEKPLDISN